MRWWRALATASFVGYFALLHVSSYYLPALGFRPEFRDGQVFVARVTPGSPAAVAGIRVGDQIIGALDLPVSNDYSFGIVNDNVPIGKAVTWRLSRDGQTVVTATTPAARALFNPGLQALVSPCLVVSLAL